MEDDDFDWLTTYGGPTIIIGERSIKYWSGIGSIEASKEFKYDEAEDFMNPKLSHYGQACEIDELVGVINNIEVPGSVIVIGDEPNPMTIMSDKENTELIIIKWDYGESEEEFYSFLIYGELVNLKNWSVDFETELIEKDYLLVDATVFGFETKDEQMVKFEVKPGIYQMTTKRYQPNELTSMYLHRLSWKEPAHNKVEGAHTAGM